jgi:bacteriorhodopsin
MRPRAAKALKVMGTTWCVFVVLGYLAVWLFSEHGGGLFSQEGYSGRIIPRYPS